MSVQQAYQRLDGEPLETLYPPRASPIGRLRWSARRSPLRAAA
jgi:hypothetical protein